MLPPWKKAKTGMLMTVNIKKRYASDLVNINMRVGPKPSCWDMNVISMSSASVIGFFLVLKQQ